VIDPKMVSKGPPPRNQNGLPTTRKAPDERFSPDPGGIVRKHVIAAIQICHPELPFGMKLAVARMIDLACGAPSNTSLSLLPASTEKQLSRVIPELISLQLRMPEVFEMRVPEVSQLETTS